MRATTISSWAQLVARALQARGIDAEQVFAQAGLDIDSLRDPNARYGFDGMRRLWKLATETTADNKYFVILGFDCI